MYSGSAGLRPGVRETQTRGWYYSNFCMFCLMPTDLRTLCLVSSLNSCSDESAADSCLLCVTVPVLCASWLTLPCLCVPVA